MIILKNTIANLVKMYKQYINSASISLTLLIILILTLLLSLLLIKYLLNYLNIKEGKKNNDKTKKSKDDAAKLIGVLK
jgi:hypothetical protein